MELQSRTWIYLSEQMLWMKSNSTAKRPDSKKKASKGKTGSDKPANAIVFNPHLWKEEVVTLQED